MLCFSCTASVSVLQWLSFSHKFYLRIVCISGWCVCVCINIICFSTSLIFQDWIFELTFLCIVANTSVGFGSMFEWEMVHAFASNKAYACMCMCMTVYTSYRDASTLCQFPSWMVWWGYSTLPTPEPTSQRKFTFPLRISKARKSTWGTQRTHAVYTVYKQSLIIWHCALYYLW